MPLIIIIIILQFQLINRLCPLGPVGQYGPPPAAYRWDSSWRNRMRSALGPLRGLNVCQALFTARELNWTRVLNTCFPPNRDVHSARTAFLEVQCEQFTATQRRCSQVVTPVQSRLDYTQTRDYSVQNFHFQCLKAPGSQNALARIVLPNLRSTPVASLLLRLHWLPVTSRKKNTNWQLLPTNQ